MVNSIVLPIKKVFALVDSKIIVEIKDDGRKLQGRLVAVDEHLDFNNNFGIDKEPRQRGDPRQQHTGNRTGSLRSYGRYR